jgi:hypothetical protein
MDAIHNTTKYGMQDIVDEMQERIDELGQQLTVSKVSCSKIPRR